MSTRKALSFGFSVCALGFSLSAFAQNFRLTILHTNDVHSWAEGSKIKKETYGGYARQATLVKKLRAKHPASLLLFAGDAFQGTLFFNTYFGLADLAAMNLIGYQAMTLGNHEFDKGPKNLGDGLKLATFPVLVANLDASQDESLKDWIKPHTILTVQGQKIGIIGVTTPDLFSITAPGDKIKLLDLDESIDRSVAALSKSGINKIILLSHCGYETDLVIAKKHPDLDVIVGAHSHTLLGKWNIDGFPPGEGPYPAVIKHKNGSQTLIVQAWQKGVLLGKLDVSFTPDGRVSESGKNLPLPLDSKIPEDLVTKSVITAFSKPIDAVANTIIGKTETGINQGSHRKGETTISNVVADAQLEKTQKFQAVLAIANAGGIRANIDAGDITFGKLITVQPFNNTLVVVELTGEEIKKSIEHGVRGLPENGGGLLYFSKGSAYEVDLSKPAGERVTRVVIAGKEMEPQATYRVVLNSFLAGGGDAHDAIKNSKKFRQDTGIADIEAFTDYVKAHSPLNPELEGRIKIREP